MTEIENALQALRAACPHGHPKFVEVVGRAVELHKNKSHDYAKGGSPLGNFERVSKILSLYPNLPLSDPTVVMLLYMLKQFDAILWSFSQDIAAKVEGRLPRLGDMLVYSAIAICSEEDKLQ